MFLELVTNDLNKTGVKWLALTVRILSRMKFKSVNYFKLLRRYILYAIILFTSKYPVEIYSLRYCTTGVQIRISKIFEELEFPWYWNIVDSFWIQETFLFEWFLCYFSNFIWIVSPYFYLVFFRKTSAKKIRK